MNATVDMLLEEILIRPAQGADAAALSSLAIRSKAYWGYDEDFLNLCRAELSYSAVQIKSRQFDFQVCTHNNEMIGFYALEKTADDVVEIEALFVEPAYIGNGIGRFLLAHAKVRAADNGAHRIVIQSDPNAVAFYVSAGAQYCGSRDSASVPGRTLPLYELHIQAGNRKPENTG